MTGQIRNRFSCQIAGALCLAMLMSGVRSAAQLSAAPNINLPAVNGTVLAIKKEGNRVYIGGRFTTVGGLARNHLAAIDATTWQVDPAWNPDVNDTVFNIVVAGGYVYASGNFITVNGGTARTGVAAFHPADGSDMGQTDAWNPILTGYTTFYNNALAAAGSKIYVGGHITAVNGVARNKIAAIEAAGTPRAGQLDPAWNPDLPLVYGDSVRCILMEGGKLYVGCNIRQDPLAGGPTAAVFALEPADGTRTGAQDPVWRPLFEQPPYVDMLPRDRYVGLFGNSMLAHGGKLYVGGYFSAVNGVARNSLAALSLADGVHPAVVDPVWNPDIAVGQKRIGDNSFSSDAGVLNLAIMNQKLVVGGEFRAVNGSMPFIWNGLAVFGLADGDNAGAVDTSWNPSPVGVLRRVNALYMFDGGLLAGGDFFGEPLVAPLWGYAWAVPVELSGFSAN